MSITEAPPAHYQRWQDGESAPLIVDSTGPAAHAFTINVGVVVVPAPPMVTSGANPVDTRPWADSQVERIEEWVNAAMRHVVTKVLPEGAVTAEVPGVDGAWVDADSAEEAIAQLPAVLFDWAHLGIENAGYEIPVVDGIDIKPR